VESERGSTILWENLVDGFKGGTVVQVEAQDIMKKTVYEVERKGVRSMKVEVEILEEAKKD